MGCHSGACDLQFSSFHQGCHNPIGRGEIPETSRQACVGVQSPTAGMRNTEMQRVRWRAVILKRRIGSQLIKLQRSSHKIHEYHTPMKYPFLSQNNSLYSVLGLKEALLLGDSCPSQRLWVTPTLSIAPKNTTVEDTVYETHTQVKWGSRWGCGLHTVACAFTYMVHSSRKPSMKPHTVWPVPSPQTLWSTAGKSLALRRNISFASFSCHIQLN